ncbi:hypothetical protein FQA39_LY08058 [Lamprigera yunnana]|nr:hypothetical protein FQA39_LY08058 [Lamprigera yunnana]
MDDIYGKKRSVNPILSLGNEIHVPIGIIQNVADNTDKTEALQTLLKDITEMREDRLQYQEKRLAVLERAHKEAMTLLKEKNEIKKERNEILKQKNCTCKPK